ncbi:MAG TPA: hypothetical protein VMD78_09050 [Candidatus Baltobacteraceae bacterium]|nr:hypothetical protein [Candidatus Baltobacteraceae bacterium]
MYACGKEIRIDGLLCRIARLDADKYEFLEDPEPTLDALRKSGTRIDLFTFLQRPTETEPKYKYPMEWDNLAVLPVSTFDEWWNKQIGFKARNKAKQALKKGVTLREVPFDEDLVRGIWEIYNETPIRQGRRFPHYGKSLDAVRKMSATYLNSSIFIGAFVETKLIGFIKLTTDDERTQAGLMHIVSLIEHRDKAPTNALVAQAVRSCAERNISHLVYSHFSYGKKETSSLSDFKERNGFKRVDLPRYYVPLSPVGSLAFRLGLHRQWVDFIPAPVLAKARGMRDSWNNRRFSAHAQES